MTPFPCSARPGGAMRAATAALALLAGAFAFFPAHGNQTLPLQLDVSYVPTPEAVVARMLEIADVQADDYVVDLGSGDGRIVIAAARDHGVKRAMGVDIDPKRIAEAQHNARKAGVADRVLFVEGDLFKTDFRDADVLTMYLLPNLNLRLRPTILEHMSPGTRIVSHAFDMGDWEPDLHEQVERRDVYLWIVPARVGGDWQFTREDGTQFDVTLTQQFQRITGRATFEDRHLPLSSISLRGAQIRFTLDEERYVGIVAGDRMSAVEEEDALTGWRAVRY